MPPQLTTHVDGIGGCDFATPSNDTARDTTVFWAPEVDASVVLLATSPPNLPTESARTTILQPGEPRRASDGLYIAQRRGRAIAYAVLLGQSCIDGPVSAVIPLDEFAADRFAASERFWRLAKDCPVADTRLTKQRCLRLRHMMRAVDGKAAHASQREIAEVIFGRRRVEAELWHESSVRYATMRLLRDGLAMVNGGYHKLLRSHRTA